VVKIIQAVKYKLPLLNSSQPEQFDLFHSTHSNCSLSMESPTSFSLQTTSIWYGIRM